MGCIGQVELLVKPEILNQKAVEVENSVANMRSRFETIRTLVSKSSGYWIGEAGNLHRQNYENQKDNIDTILRRLAEHPGDLRTIAQTYTSVELKAQEIASDLPGDVL